MNPITIKKDRYITKEEEDAFASSTLEAFYQDEELSKFASTYDLDRSTLLEGAVEIAQVLSDNKRCEGCKSLSKCVKRDRPGTKLTLVFNQYTGQVENKYVYCDYKAKWTSYLENLRYTHVSPDKARDSYNNILSFVKSSLDTKSQLKSLLAEASTVLATKDHQKNFRKGYYVISPNTNGRIFLQYLMIKAVTSGIKTMFISSPKLFIPLTDRVESGARQEAISTYEMAKDIELLLIDDFGLEPKSYQIRDYYLIPLLNERRKRGLFTCLTSRLTKSEISKAYAKDHATASLILDSLNYVMDEREIIEPELFESN